MHEHKNHHMFLSHITLVTHCHHAVRSKKTSPFKINVDIRQNTQIDKTEILSQ